MKYRGLTLINTAFVLAAVGYAIMATGCGPAQYDPAAAQAEELKIDDPYWHRISPLPKKNGFYKMYDHEDGRICYMTIEHRRGQSLECQYNADEPVHPPQENEPAPQQVDMRVSMVRFNKGRESGERPRPKCTPRKPCVIPKPCYQIWQSGCPIIKRMS